MKITEVAPPIKIRTVQYARTIEELRANITKAGIAKISGEKLKLKELKLKSASLTSCFNLPKGCQSIHLSGNKLKTLDFLDLSVATDLWVNENELTTLLIDGQNGFPESFTTLNISNNRGLTSLEGGPVKNVGDLFANSCGLTSLKGAPRKIFGEFQVFGNKLRTLEGIPSMIAGTAEFDENGIVEIGDTGEFVVVEKLSLVSNKITSLKDIDKKLKRCSVLDLTDNPLKSQVLGILRITDLKDFICDDNNDLNEIMNKHLKSDVPVNQKIIRCQSDLLDAGLDEFAQL